LDYTFIIYVIEKIAHLGHLLNTSSSQSSARRYGSSITLPSRSRAAEGYHSSASVTPQWSARTLHRGVSNYQPRNFMQLMESKPLHSNRGDEHTHSGVVTLQDTIEVVGSLRDAILNGPNSLVQSRLLQRVLELCVNKAHHDLSEV